MSKNKTVLKLFLIFIFIFSNNLFSQKPYCFENKIDSLNVFFDSLKNSNSVKEVFFYSKKIDSIFMQLLSEKKSFFVDFSKIKDNCSVLFSEDEKIRIITWNNYTGDFFYYGYIQYYDKKNDKFYFFKLNDKSSEIDNPKTEKLNFERWFGCVYYDIVTVKHKYKTYYTLLGWDGNNNITNKKIIEVLSFQFKKPKFGYDFRVEEDNFKRLIFEYGNQMKMSLKWNKSEKMIIWDHLSPSEPKFEGIYQYYGPDFSYDGLVFKRGQWIYVSDVKVNNPE